jgi:hypothetical protein
MPPSAAFGFEQLVTELLRGLIEAVADRPGETEAQRFSRHQTVVFSTMAFMPRDALETMLASQCVMLDHLMRDATRDLLRGQEELIKLRLRPQLTAMGRLFLRHLTELKRLQTRPVEQIAVLPHAKPEPRPDAVPRTDDAKPAGAALSATAGRVPPSPPAAGADSAAPAARDTGTAAAPVEAPRHGKSALLLRRGFQNRRARRANQFKGGAGHSLPPATPHAAGKPAVRTGSGSGRGQTGL